MPPEPPPNATSTTGQPSWMAPVRPVVPDHELLRRIGGGSYGDVWLARTTVGTWRAVKVVFRDRFTDARPYEREFNGIQKFEPLSRGNEAFIDILQIGRNDAEGYFYYVMELADDAASPQVESSELRVEGEAKSPEKCSTLNFQPSTYVPKTLAKVLLQRGRLPVSECLELGLTLNLGLAHLHRAGLIHRDIKPSNIIFVSGVPKLADIGLVIEVAEARSFVGTEGFIPPEGPNSPRADLFSLGKVLYEAGMGKDRKDFPEPFTQLAESPDATELLEFNAILLKACAASATERYQTAEEMNADLALLQSGGSVRRQRKLAGQLRFRIRIQQAVHQIPRVLHVLVHESGVLASDFSPDGRRIATGTMDGKVRVWDAQSGALLWPAREMGRPGQPAIQLRFARDGHRLFASSSPPQNSAAQGAAPTNFLAVLEVESGQDVIPRISSNVVWSTFSPDDRWLVVAHSDHVIRILDARDGRLVTELKGHTNLIMMPSFTSDGSLFASASRDGTARLWRLPSGEPLGSPLPHSQAVGRAILSDDGRRLATSTIASRDKAVCVIQVWDTATGRAVGGPLTLSNAANALFFDHSGERLFTGAEHEPQLHVRNASTLAHELPALEMNGQVAYSAFSPDGTRLAIGSDDQMARIWSVKTGELLFPAFRHTAWVLSVCFSPDGGRLLTTSNDDTAKLWDLNFSPEIAVAQLDAEILQEDAARFRADLGLGRRKGPLPITLMDGSVRLVDPDSLREVHRLVPTGKDAPPDRCEVAPSGSQWAAFRRNRPNGSPQSVDLWREQDGVLRHLVLEHPGRVHQAVGFSQDETRLLTGCEDRQIRIWRTADGAIERTVTVPAVDAFVASFSPDRRLALLYFGGPNLADFEIFDLESGKTLGTRFSSLAMADVAFNPQSSRIATVGFDSTARIFDARTGQALVPPCKNPDSMLWLDWSPDGRRLLAAGAGPEAMIWDTTTGEFLLSPLRTGTKATRTARWSADGRFIVTHNDDNFARVWDAATAEAVTPRLRHKGHIRFACITRNNRLITGSDPNVLRAWDLTETSLPPDVLADYAKLLSGRRLNASGVLLPLKPTELADLCHSLRARAPELFK